jgi:signal transduction histidine kinase
MFRLSRQFVLVCVPALLVVGILLVLLYQTTTNSAIIELGERSNLSVAWATLSSSRPQVIEFLEQSASATPVSGKELELDLRFTAAVSFLMTETQVYRVKIYNANGIVAYSTKPEQVGDNRADNPRFLMSMQGVVSSDLIIDSSYDAHEQRPGAGHLIQTYIPVQAGPTLPIVGVLEIYTNVDYLFEKIEKTKLLVFLVAVVTLVGLFIVLWWSTLRAERTIARHRTIIDERSHSLELLAERLSSAQEAERQSVSRELNEGLGQTLAAIKLAIEDDHTTLMPGQNDSLIRLLQQAMADVRRTAMGLRPPSLDEAGAISTIAWYCRQFESAHPDIAVTTDLKIKDPEIPQRFVTAIFRIVQETLRDLVRFTDSKSVHISLDSSDEYLRLEFRVGMPPFQNHTVETESTAESSLKHALGPLTERATLFGAHFEVEQSGELEITITSTWSMQNVSYLWHSDNLNAG